MHSKATVKLLRSVVKDAWSSLTPIQRKGVRRSDMAAAILQKAAQGERDPVKLKEVARASRKTVSSVVTANECT